MAVVKWKTALCFPLFHPPSVLSLSLSNAFFHTALLLGAQATRRNRVVVVVVVNAVRKWETAVSFSIFCPAKPIQRFWLWGWAYEYTFSCRIATPRAKTASTSCHLMLFTTSGFSCDRVLCSGVTARVREAAPRRPDAGWSAVVMTKP